MAAKRSLFKKPAWAAEAKAPAVDGKSIFQQNIYEDILRENQRKEERRLAKQKQKQNNEQKKPARKSDAEDDKQPNKKRRLSVEAYTVDSDLDADDDEEKFADGYESPPDSDTVNEATRTKTRSTRSNRRSSSSRETTPAILDSPRKPKRADKRHNHNTPDELRKTTQTNNDDDLIVIEEDSAKPSPKTCKTKAKKPTLPESESDSESDEYVRELKRKARSEALARKMQAAQSQAIRENSAHSPSTAPGSSHTLDGHRNSNTPTPANISATDPEVLIRIKTIIPGCNEVFVKRKASQTLEGLEKYFVETHKMSDQLRKKLFFTWNLQKLYKSTTMSSILAQIKAKHGTNRDGSDRSEGRIELEAMTVEILDLRKQQLERDRRIESGEWQEGDQREGDAGSNAVEPSIEPEEQVQPKKGIVVQLKSNNEKDLPSMALRVHPDTAVSRIIRGYKSKMRVDPSRKVYLVFEGDRLEGEQIVEDIGLEDEDCIDLAAD